MSGIAENLFAFHDITRIACTLSQTPRLETARRWMLVCLGGTGIVSASLTREDLAEMTGMAQSYFSQWHSRSRPV